MFGSVPGRLLLLRSAHNPGDSERIAGLFFASRKWPALTLRAFGGDGSGGSHKVAEGQNSSRHTGHGNFALKYKVSRLLLAVQGADSSPVLIEATEHRCSGCFKR
jgi:hypothetical protein